MSKFSIGDRVHGPWGRGDQRHQISGVIVSMGIDNTHKGYSALHDHVDANDYPLAVCAMEWLEADDFAFANRLEEVVDARIRAGDLRTVAVGS